jgi:FMN phosphatase YigB (HAD superfamily)
MRKPNTDIFEYALKELKASPEEVVFIDDKEEHLNGARRVGIGTIQFTDTKDAIEQIRALNGPNESYSNESK